MFGFGFSTARLERKIEALAFEVAGLSVTVTAGGRKLLTLSEDIKKMANELAQLVEAVEENNQKGDAVLAKIEELIAGDQTDAELRQGVLEQVLRLKQQNAQFAAALQPPAPPAPTE